MHAGSERCLDIDNQLQPLAAMARQVSSRHDESSGLLGVALCPLEGAPKADEVELYAGAKEEPEGTDVLARQSDGTQ